MSRMSRLIPALITVFLMAACSDASNTPVGPEGPSYDSGVGSTGGNRDDDSGTTTTSSTTESDSVPPAPGGVGSTGGN